MPPLRSAGTGPEAEDPQYAGQYRLEARLGAGGMGVVHLARSPSGMRLAVKVVHTEFAADPEFRARFRQEVTAARRVSGAFTAPVVDADPYGERPWMATLYIPGPTLAEHVKQNGPLSPDEVRRLAAGLAEALRDIHRAGVVHRDLKPSNVLLAADGPRVIDFGISRPSDSDLRTETGKLIGTPPFMAPEQFQRPREVGPAADVFTLGSVLVHAATGRGPFSSESPYIVAYQVVHDEADLAGVSDDLLPLIRGCLAKNPADRPTPDGLMSALRAGGHGPFVPLSTPRVPFQRAPSSLERDIAAAGADALFGPHAGDGGESSAGSAGSDAGFGGGGAEAGGATGAPAAEARGAAGPAGSAGAAGAIPDVDGFGDVDGFAGGEGPTHVRAGTYAAGGTGAHDHPEQGPTEGELSDAHSDGDAVRAGRGAGEAGTGAGADAPGAGGGSGVMAGGEVWPDASAEGAKGSGRAGRAGPVVGGRRGRRAGRRAGAGPSRVLARLGLAGRPVRWLAAAAALVVLLGAGTVWTLRQIDDFGSNPDPTRPAAAGDSWRPWRIALRDAAGLPAARDDSARMTFCDYGEGALYCAQRGITTARLDPRQGRLLWSTDGPATGAAGESRPAGDATTRDADADTPGGDPATGAPAEPDQVVAGPPSAPVFAAGLVQTLSPDGTLLTARDPASKRQRWTREVSAYAGRVYRAGDSVLLVAADGTVTSIDAATNRPRWSHRVAAHTLPVFTAFGSGRRAYAISTAPDGAHTLVSAIDPVRGTVHWTRTLSGDLTPVGEAGNGVVRFAASDTESRTTAVLRYDPARRTERRVPLTVPLHASSIATSDEMVYLLGYDGGLVAVDTRPGAPRRQPWRLETSVSNASPLVAAGDRLYFSAADGRLFAVDGVGGRLLGQTPPRPGPAKSGYLDQLPAPVAAEGKVFAAAPDGSLFAVDDRVPSRW
ncbi:PQQ-binding-like beta-propeller repeat protein [Streptomyces sp. NPDC057702]|uniref:protein kinase domain-containing protein n=1 Tax=unclassified Streptomyces TaxID=2593676 RepID=UPI0036757730